jgi:hypothetical protein
MSPVLWCARCGEQDEAGEDRSCLTCGGDVVLFADRRSMVSVARVVEIMSENHGIKFKRIVQLEARIAESEERLTRQSP